MQRVVVVGAGLAGARSVQELRAQRYTGEVVLLGAEPHLPYDRPPLSKQVLLGLADDSPLDGPLEADVRLSVRATGLRPGLVETDAGEVPYDGLVLACGARAVNPWGEGVVLRTLDDALRLRAALVPGARVVVVGAGWIGAEVATAAVAAHCRVTVVEAAATPLAGALGEVGGLTVPWYAAAAVDLRLSSPVSAVEPDSVTLTSGERLPADVVVVGVGARPDTAWLEGSGLELDRGVVVDEHLAASWPHVVAVGDCAAWWSRRFAARLRVEHWDDALHAPAAAVTTLLGVPRVHDPVPYFWSEQLGHRLQHVGHAAAADRVVHRGEPGDPEGWGVAWLQGERLLAFLAVDRPKELGQARRRVGEDVDAGRLADPSVPLRAV
ncbi:MAG: FAD-dependent pyridine nucleotide-disulfide oxidoreductase [Frankiales bacterium]|nr:FAD-dependent pyridine nucleotide-disulfide oxidoreductase [Frankiales bacterium]